MPAWPVQAFEFETSSLMKPSDHSFPSNFFPGQLLYYRSVFGHKIQKVENKVLKLQRKENGLKNHFEHSKYQIFIILSVEGYEV